MPPDAGERGSREKRFVTTTVEVEGRDETKIVELPAFEPDPWGADATLSIVGTGVPRVDAREKVTGRAQYTADIVRPGMLYAAFVRARIPRGRATSIALEAARAIPGVVDVMGAGDLASLPRPIRTGGVALFDPNIAYAGQPLGVVCATSLYGAMRGAASVRVEYEVLPFALTAEQALAPGAPAVRPSGNLSRTSPVVETRGDVERGLAEADIVVRRTYRTPSVLHSAMEAHGAVAEWSGDQLTVWESTQGIFKVRDEVASALGLRKSQVRVLMEHMGGGFGAKNNAGAHTYAAALLARRTGRAVRCVLDREGEQTDTGHRPETTIHVTLGARADGTLTAIAAEADVAQGISGWEASPAQIFHQLYACANVRTTERFVYVNTQAMAAFRGPGHVEGAFALECAMDVLARAVGLDPLELRLRNHADHDQEKDRPYSGGSLRRCLEEGAARFGWRRRGTAVRPEDAGSDAGMTHAGGTSGNFPAGGRPRVRRGFGMAAQIWPAGGGPPAYATVRLHPDGSVDVLTGTQDLGTGARTILAQVAAEALGTRLEQVRVVLGDTERTPYTGNSWGSMTTPSVAPAVRMAAEDARRTLLEAAAEIMNCSPDDLAVHGGTIDKRDGTQHLAISEVTRRLGQVTITGHGSRGPNPAGVGLMTFGAQFAEVEVDSATGVVRVVRIVAAHDAGRIINPVLAQSQLEGGILQGLGFALFEERIIDGRLGLPLNTGLHDYKIPTMSDVPAIDAFCVDAVDTVANHVGSRGLAEPPIIPTAPAIANAVANALGVEVSEIPLTPWRVQAAMAARGA